MAAYVADKDSEPLSCPLARFAMCAALRLLPV
jgi:hypothetical protein